MYYQSTRRPDLRFSPSEAILQGLAPDGGLFIFDHLPELDVSEVLSLSPMEQSARILEAFFPDLTGIPALVREAYEGKFDTPDLVPTVEAGPYHFLELFHGPTCAFKDIALCLLPHLMRAASVNREDAPTLHILTATSGDTGKAALSGFADVPGTKITVFYPDGGVSALQRLQMVTQQGNNVSVYGIRGNFDDAQTGVKALFTDKELEDELAAKHIRLSSANSINIGRLIPQVMYYFKAYSDLLRAGTVRMGDKIDFSVPTGNFGDILAGYLAAALGLPVGKLLIAANINHVLTDFVETGVYDRRRELYLTVAPSMDILVSSNLERLLYLLSGAETSPKAAAAATAGYMRDLKETGRYEIPEDVHSKLTRYFWSTYADDFDAKETIRSYYQQYGYLMDPHTAIGCYTAEKYRQTCPEDDLPIVILSTASCYKFPATVLEALGNTVPEDPFEQLSLLQTITNISVPAPILALQDLPERHTGVISREEMKSVIQKEGEM
ncbi:MAG: threonine synthase [Firmicutes bacterium]|nr:threonine synthase [Bacillota bacterium]